jgi:hypothetical protein
MIKYVANGLNMESIGPAERKFPIGRFAAAQISMTD